MQTQARVPHTMQDMLWMASCLEPVHARGEDNAPHSLEYNEESQEGMPSRVFDVDVRNETIALPAGPAFAGVAKPELPGCR